MDQLLQCAKNYELLLDYKYHFVIGRKGVHHDFELTFQKTDFHHLAGLHKLTDKRILQHNARNTIFDWILKGKINLEFLKSSYHYEKMNDRLSALVNLGKLLDSDHLIFKYNENVRVSSAIKSEYLLEGCINEMTLFLFLGCRNDKDLSNQMCRSFFPKDKIDYSVGQPLYTLLKKEKFCISDGSIVSSYERK